MFKFTPAGDTALRIEFGTTISPEINQTIRGFSLLLEKERIEGVIEWVPAYTSMTIFYDPYRIRFNQLLQKVKLLYTNSDYIELPANLIYVPTYYGEEAGPDLESVAAYHQLSVKEVIEIHSEAQYLIYMMGFIPGFPYLGGMSKQIATPRLETPRATVPLGSVGIGGEQTGIYPIETPGGWRIIGRTPLRLYDPYRNPPMLLKAGNYLKFVPITKEEYERIENDVKSGAYRLITEKINREGM